MSRHHDGYRGRGLQERTAATLDRYGTRCHLCGGQGADTSDHVIPHALGGHPTDLANRRPAHHDCNRRRGAMPLSEWFAANPLPARTTPSPSRDW